MNSDVECFIIVAREFKINEAYGFWRKEMIQQQTNSKNSYNTQKASEFN